MPSRSLLSLIVVTAVGLVLMSGCALMSYPPRLVPVADDGFMLMNLQSADAEAKTTCRLASDGRQMWCLALTDEVVLQGGYPTSRAEHINAVTQPPDGGIVCAGGKSIETKYHDRTQSHFVPLMIRLDGKGQRIWQQTLETSGTFYATAATLDGGIVAAGMQVQSYQPLTTEAASGWFNPDGQLQRWMAYPAAEDLRAAIPLKDGSCVFIGTTMANAAGTNKLIYLVKIMSDGQTAWQRQVEIADGIELLDSAIQTADGGFVIAGGVMFGKDENRLYVARLTSDGRLAWKNLFTIDKGGAFSFPPSVFDMVQRPDGRLLVVGEIEAGYPAGFAACLDTAGKPSWITRTQVDNTPCRFQAIDLNPDGSCTLFGVYEKGASRNTIHQAILEADGQLRPAL